MTRRFDLFVLIRFKMVQSRRRFWTRDEALRTRVCVRTTYDSGRRWTLHPKSNERRLEIPGWKCRLVCLVTVILFKWNLSFFGRSLCENFYLFFCGCFCKFLRKCIPGKCCVVNIITVSKNKKVITNELFSSPQILHHAPKSAQDSGNNYPCGGHQTIGPNTTMLKRFIRLLI